MIDFTTLYATFGSLFLYVIEMTFVPFLFSMEIFFLRNAAVDIYSPAFLPFFIFRSFSFITLSITRGDWIISSSSFNPEFPPEKTPAKPGPTPWSAITKGFRSERFVVPVLFMYRSDVTVYFFGRMKVRAIKNPVIRTKVKKISFFLLHRVLNIFLRSIVSSSSSSCGSIVFLSVIFDYKRYDIMKVFCCWIRYL